MNTHRLLCWVCIVAHIAALSLPASAQIESGSRPRGVQPAAFERRSSEQPSIRFSRYHPRIGDEVEQRISLETRLTTLVREQSKLVDMKKTVTLSKQHRAVTTTELHAGRTTAVAVHYLDATTAIEPPEKVAPGEPPGPTMLPVQGKMYYCRREPGDHGKLVVTNENGQTPPPEELEIVAQNMEALGRPNPLADFLAGRSIAVGQTIVLPNDVANRIFNLGDRFGEVERFELILQETCVEGGVPCAVFQASVEAASHDSSQMRLEVQGPLVVEIDTCRCIRMKLAGPIAMSEVQGSYLNMKQFIGTGQLNMTIASAYRDAAR